MIVGFKRGLVPHLHARSYCSSPPPAGSSGEETTGHHNSSLLLSCMAAPSHPEAPCSLRISHLRLGVALPARRAAPPPPPARARAGQEAPQAGRGARVMPSALAPSSCSATRRSAPSAGSPSCSPTTRSYPIWVRATPNPQDHAAMHASLMNLACLPAYLPAYLPACLPSFPEAHALGSGPECVLPLCPALAACLPARFP